MKTDEDDLVTRPVSKNTIPAAGAPKLQVTTANSVFALGGGANTPAAHDAASATVKRRPRAPAVPTQRAIDTIRSCGDLDKTQFASAMSLTNTQSQKMLMKLLAAGVIQGSKAKGQLTRYSVVEAAGKSAPPKHGIKGWLARKGEPTAAGRASTKRTAVVKVERSADALPPADDKFVCGLFNTGELVLEVDGNRMRLTKTRTRALVTYLDQIAAAIDVRNAA